MNSFISKTRKISFDIRTFFLWFEIKRKLEWDLITQLIHYLRWFLFILFILFKTELQNKWKIHQVDWLHFTAFLTLNFHHDLTAMFEKKTRLQFTHSSIRTSGTVFDLMSIARYCYFKLAKTELRWKEYRI